MKKTIFFLLALLFGASLYFNAPDKGLFSQPKQVEPEDAPQSLPISESKTATLRKDNNEQNLIPKNKIIEVPNSNSSTKTDIQKTTQMNQEQNSFANADGIVLQDQFIFEDDDIAWKVKEEDFYRVFYSEWLSTYPETNTEIEIECKSQHCKLKLTSIVGGSESFKALASFIKALANSGRPFNLLKFKPTDDFAEIMTLRVDG